MQKFLELNGSLAIQLAYDWMKNNPDKISNKSMIKTLEASDPLCLDIFEEMENGLLAVNPPGRFQVVQHKKLT